MRISEENRDYPGLNGLRSAGAAQNTMANVFTEHPELDAAISACASADPIVLANHAKVNKHQPFAEAEKPAAGIKQIAELAKGAPLDALPMPHLNDYVNAFKGAAQAIQSILSFTSVDGQGDIRAQLNANIKQQHKNLFTQALPVIVFGKLAIGDTRDVAMRSDIEATLLVVAGIKDDAEKAIKTSREEIDAILKSIRETAAREAVSREARFFESQASQFAEEAKKWLRYSMISLLGTLAVTVVIYSTAHHYASDSVPAAIQAVVGKLVLLSLCVSVVVFCGRNYATCRHNAVANEHRKVALQSFQAFLAGTEDPRVRAQLVLEVAKAAYAPVSTGYLRRESAAPPTNQLVEVITGLASPKA